MDYESFWRAASLSLEAAHKAVAAVRGRFAGMKHGDALRGHVRYVCWYAREMSGQYICGGPALVRNNTLKIAVALGDIAEILEADHGDVAKEIRGAAASIRRIAAV